ncbi:MAG: phosphatase [Candidatus Saganbacteria bacterium]|nr:phosphatase [Candidatus Saganbacteria bacterium]
MTKIQLIADLHAHTLSSGHGFSTLEEYVMAAKKKKLKAIAITDHGPAMPGGPHNYYFSNMRMIPKEMDGIRIYKGIEANIVDENGTLDLENDILKTLDVVMIAFHPRVGYEPANEEKNTEVLLKAMENPHVGVIAHPGNPMYPVNIAVIAKAARDKKIILEINNSSFTFSRKGSWDRCLQFAKEVKKENWMVSVGSDAHISTMLGEFDEALKLVSLAGLNPENIVNTSTDKIEKYILRK